MATTTYGTEYVQSSDLVSNYPGTSQNVANRIDDVSLKGNGLNNQTGTTYTLTLTDGGKNVTLNNASAVTLTVPTFASIAFPTGTMVGLVNKGAGTVTVGGAGVTLNGADLTIKQNETATILKLDTNTWVMAKGGGLPKASYSATTGAPTVTTVSGKTCVQFTGSGTITTKAGIVEVLAVGPGAGGGGSASGTSSSGGGGGGGGGVLNGQIYLTDGTYTITVPSGGAGGSGLNNGVASSPVRVFLSTNLAPVAGGGGGGHANSGIGVNGGSQVGGNGGTGGGTGGAGGAGDQGAGAAQSSGNGGAGGAGVTSSITGSSMTVGAGGGGGASTTAAKTGGISASGGNGGNQGADGTNGTAN